MSYRSIISSYLCPNIVIPTHHVPQTIGLSSSFRHSHPVLFSVKKRMNMHKKNKVQKLAQISPKHDNTMHLKPIEQDPIRFYLNNPEVKALEQLRFLPSYATARNVALPKPKAKPSSSGSSSSLSSSSSAATPSGSNISNTTTKATNKQHPIEESLHTPPSMQSRFASIFGRRQSKEPAQSTSTPISQLPSSRSSLTKRKALKQQEQREALVKELSKLEGSKVTTPPSQPQPPKPPSLSLMARFKMSIQNINRRSVLTGVKRIVIAYLVATSSLWAWSQYKILTFTPTDIPSTIQYIPYVPYNPDSAPYDEHYFKTNALAIAKNSEMVDSQLFAIHAYFKHTHPKMKQSLVYLNNISNFTESYLFEMYENNPVYDFTIPKPSENPDVFLVIKGLLSICQQFIDIYHKISKEFTDTYEDSINNDVVRPRDQGQKIADLAIKFLQRNDALYANTTYLRNSCRLYDALLYYQYQKSLSRLQLHSKFRESLTYRISTLDKCHDTLMALSNYLSGLSPTADISRAEYLLRESRKLYNIVETLSYLHSSSGFDLKKYHELQKVHQYSIAQLDQGESKYFPLMASFRYGYRTPRVVNLAYRNAQYYIPHTDEDYLIDGFSDRNIQYASLSKDNEIERIKKRKQRLERRLEK